MISATKYPSYTQTEGLAMASIRCAHCKATHTSVAEVRACSGIATLVAPPLAPRRRSIPALPPKTVAQTVLAEVPAGHYALTNADGVIKFYRVDRPEKGAWKGYTFVNVQASDDYYPVRDRARRQQVLIDIAKDPAAASKLYAKELGRCGVCNRTLTDPDSIANAIGPVCAAKRGW